MPVDYYPQKTIEQLVALLESLQSRQAKGAITEVLAAGVRTVRELTGSSRPEAEILRVLYSLYLRAQGTEEADNWPNPYAGRITRTRPSYLGTDEA